MAKWFTGLGRSLIGISAYGDAKELIFLRKVKMSKITIDDLVLNECKKRYIGMQRKLPFVSCRTNSYPKHFTNVSIGPRHNVSNDIVIPSEADKSYGSYWSGCAKAMIALRLALWPAS